MAASSAKTKLISGVAGVLLLSCATLFLGAWSFLPGSNGDGSRYGVAFNLIDDRGAPISEQALQGHPALVYFGYTHCPEVCPTTLYDMASWIKELGPAADDLRAYFFTVDPERDTTEIMHGYAANFTDRIVGITGDPKEMQKVIAGWQIFAKKVPGADGEYTMDHTASVFLVDRKGRLKGTIAYGEDANVALPKIRALLQPAG